MNKNRNKNKIKNAPPSERNLIHCALNQAENVFVSQNPLGNSENGPFLATKTTVISIF